MSEFEQRTEQFLSRDYVRDVALLDRALAKKGSESAGLTPNVPPSVLTGDPFALEPGRNIAVFGLNPKCLGVDTRAAGNDVLVSKALIDAGDIAGYRQQRAGYFMPANPQYNPTHFNRLIERIQLGLSGRQAFSPERFGQQAAMFDLLPWWSADTDRLNGGRCTRELAPLDAWHTVVAAFIRDKRPRAIIVNGSGFRRWTEDLFGTVLKAFHYDAGKGRAFRAFAGSGRGGTPVLVHGQVRAQTGPQSLEQYRSMMSAWRRVADVPDFGDLI